MWIGALLGRALEICRVTNNSTDNYIGNKFYYWVEQSDTISLVRSKSNVSSFKRRTWSHYKIVKFKFQILLKIESAKYDIIKQ